jgi:hypothetical protein
VRDDRKADVCNDAAVVAYYDGQGNLQEPEQLLFEKRLRNGMRILDIGFLTDHTDRPCQNRL